MLSLKDEKIGGATIRIVAQAGLYRGCILRGKTPGGVVEDADLERLRARLRNEAGKLHPNYVGVAGAVARFLRFFHDGFQDPLFLEDERAYKERANDKLNGSLPLERAATATPEQAAAIRSVFVTNILSPFELARCSAVLRGPTGADFVRAAAAFAQGEYGAGLAAMTVAVAPQGRISWPIATYLPNLWQPLRHMFLKPTVTLDYAQRIGHPFQYAYDAAMEPGVYEALLGLVADTEVELASMGPRDRIDVQSFIYVVGGYTDADGIKLDARRGA